MGEHRRKADGRRVFSTEFKRTTVQRILSGECGSSARSWRSQRAHNAGNNVKTRTQISWHVATKLWADANFVARCREIVGPVLLCYCPSSLSQRQSASYPRGISWRRLTEFRGDAAEFGPYFAPDIGSIRVIARVIASINELIRPQQQRLGNLQAQRFGGLQVNDQFEAGNLLDGEISRFRSIENPVYQAC